eukprot:gnl/Spiro4/22978_TR11344_c0_g2_i1.p1 gnl/Spiro4/22978_TR11344_c0_g2~~gnl/Spiro4/22978_TR11344_c0_g2_i1.p1  ORF type:complete len:1100 (+),score=248.77 gnl/Spiro4/22978_TR11344_c0_g2_i1:73-3372(+)
MSDHPLLLLRDDELPDVGMLDELMSCFCRGSGPQFEIANRVLTIFAEQPASWTKVDHIINCTQNPATRVYAMGILSSCIKKRWRIIPLPQRVGIKDFVVGLVIRLSSSSEELHSDKPFINKLNECLVEILKHDWPSNWNQFIPEICSASRSSATLCENNMSILKTLSEEIFEFSRETMTTEKTRILKQSLHDEFRQIYSLCEYVLDNPVSSSLVVMTLETLHGFLSWIPLVYIFDSKLIENLIKYLQSHITRNQALRCLVEIGALNTDQLFLPRLQNLFVVFVGRLTNMIPAQLDLPMAYVTGTDSDKQFLWDTTLFLTNYLKLHLALIEGEPQLHPLLGEGLGFLVRCSWIDDFELFKTCVEFWQLLAKELYTSEEPFIQAQQQAMDAMAGNAANTPFFLAANPAAVRQSPRLALFAPVLSQVRLVLISRMTKPEEVIIVKDDSGQWVRERTTKNTSALQLYKSMREALVYLTNLDVSDTESIMLHKLQLQITGEEWGWEALNSLCWAFGSISGAMTEEAEKRFLVHVIKQLLNLCENKRGKDNKAVVASNIMYIVGQHPRFLRNHWKFLKTVVVKLFEFMHELHPGVRDMSVDTYLKICKQCRRKFVVVQHWENSTYLEEILTDLPRTITDLEDHQIHTFFEATAYLVRAEGDAEKRIVLLQRLMQLPDTIWLGIVENAIQDCSVLQDIDIAKKLVFVLRCNMAACRALGYLMLPQMTQLYIQMLDVYKAYGDLMLSQVAANGPSCIHMFMFVQPRLVKKEILNLVRTFIETCDNTPEIRAVLAENFVPPLMEPVLGDYNRCLDAARDYEVINLLTAIVNKLQNEIAGDIPRIFSAVFESTLGMICNDTSSFPDHRSHFFSLLRAVDRHCFTALFSIPAHQFKLVIDAIRWAFKHEEKNIAETGLVTLHELLIQVSQCQVANEFYRMFFKPILLDIFYVLSDTMHNPGFKYHAKILMLMIGLVMKGHVQVPLWDDQVPPADYPSNHDFLVVYISQTLTSCFPHVDPTHLRVFTQELFLKWALEDEFKNHLRDFLVQVKEFSAGDNSLWKEEERNVRQQVAATLPGMQVPHRQMEPQEEQIDSESYPAVDNNPDLLVS